MDRGELKDLTRQVMRLEPHARIPVKVMDALEKAFYASHRIDAGDLTPREIAMVIAASGGIPQVDKSPFEYEPSPVGIEEDEAAE